MARHIAYLRLETASLRSDVKEAIAATAAAGKLLSEIGAAAYDAGADRHGASTAAELRACAARLRGAALHASTVLAELQAHAGRIEQIASVLDWSGEES